jgi:hypothetical protein
MLLQEGFANARVSMLGPVSVAYAILSFHRAHGLTQGLRGGRSELWHTNLPEDAVRWEAKHAFNEKAHARGRGGRTSPKHRSQGGKGARGRHPLDSVPLMRGMMTPPPLSSLCITLPLLCDIVCWQVGTSVNKRQSK